MQYYQPQMQASGIYPGEYTLSNITTSMLREFGKRPGKSMEKPLLNWHEDDDCFHIYFSLPGVERENIVLDINDRVLRLVVLSTDSQFNTATNEKIHEFDPPYLMREITLPDNAETGFLSAVYNCGILQIHIPKDETAMHFGNVHIAVY